MISRSRPNARRTMRQVMSAFPGRVGHGSVDSTVSVVLPTALGYEKPPGAGPAAPASGEPHQEVERGDGQDQAGDLSRTQRLPEYDHADGRQEDDHRH